MDMTKLITKAKLADMKARDKASPWKKNWDVDKHGREEVLIKLPEGDPRLKLDWE